MDASLRLRSVQHDKVVSFRTLFFVIPSESEESSAWMLHCAYASLSMTSAVSFRALFFVIPSESEESSAMWMLHFAYAQRSVQHDKCGVIPSALFCHSERERGIQCDVDASLRSA
jgi:hypothetical protein